jgi:kynureninase
MKDKQVARYCIDTSSLVHAWHRAYRPRNFESFWRKIDEYIDRGVIIASIEVKNELKKKDDEVHTWAKARPDGFFVDIDDALQDHLAHIMGAYPRLVDTVKGRSECDPFVIALARSYSKKLIVISQENSGKKNSPKIPDVCLAEGIKCLNLVEFIEAEDWRF